MAEYSVVPGNFFATGAPGLRVREGLRVEIVTERVRLKAALGEHGSQG